MARDLELVIKQSKEAIKNLERSKKEKKQVVILLSDDDQQDPNQSVSSIIAVKGRNTGNKIPQAKPKPSTNNFKQNTQAKKN